MTFYKVEQFTDTGELLWEDELTMRVIKNENCTVNESYNWASDSSIRYQKSS